MATSTKPADAAPPTPSDDPTAYGIIEAQAWEELLRTGIARREGELDPRWQSLLGNYLRGGVSISLACEFGGVSFATGFGLLGGVGIGVTQRRRIGRGGDGQATVIAHDPLLELCVFRTRAVWDVVRRVLPPVEHLRIASSTGVDVTNLPRPEGIERFDGRADVRSVMESLESHGGGWPCLHAVRDPKATVFLTIRAHTACLSGPPDAVWCYMWAIGSDDLAYWVPLSATSSGGLATVGPGHVAERLRWNLSGAFTTMADIPAGEAA